MTKTIITDQEKKISKNKLIMIGLMALFCAFLLAVFKANMNKVKIDAWHRVLIEDALNCSPKQLVIDPHPWSQDQKNENGCAHQTSTNSICDISGKRRSLHFQTC